MSFVFLFNVMCAIVSCDPYYTPPTSKPYAELSENSLLLSGLRHGRHLDSANSTEDLLPLVQPPPPVVETKSGVVEGYFMKVVSGRDIYAFEGIPFAEAPVGTRRFQNPVPKQKWRGIRQAKKPGHFCVQMHQARLNRVIGHEDCLTLNIYTPQITIDGENPKFGVAIFLHGGSFFYGAGIEYGPAYMLKNGNVILVTINYRLGVLGFLSTGDSECPGNYGLKDQALAIKWVVDNIASFGGDPFGITLMGQSAGAVAVHLHTMSTTKHLFQRAISMSASGFVGWAVHTPHQARKWAEKLARFMRCPTTRGTKAMMNCFRTRNPNFLTGNLYNLYDIIGFPPVLLRPVIEPDLPGAFLTLSPKEAYEQGQVSKIPFLVTNTEDEAEFIRIILTGFGFFRLFLRNWEVLAPTIMDYRRITDNSSAVTHAIADYYFKGLDIAKMNGKELTKVGTDRYFYTGNRQTLKHHSKIAPTYSYIFSFKNPKGFAHLFGMNPQDFGVSHSEDLSFVFNSSIYWEAFNGNEDAFAVSNLVVNLFTNFISKGEPLYTDENGKDQRIWEPVKDPDNPIFLQINEEVKMIADPFKEAKNFWEKLALNDSFAYEYA